MLPMSCRVRGEPFDYTRATVNGVNDMRQLHVKWAVGVLEVSAFIQQSSQRSIIYTNFMLI